ncbi:hypothetical protein GCM10010210_49200 [Pseudonocardia hydrocarbonoxydans]|uniref:Uncharacterized protein n=1 Tax=Pseudonocardia hydrocarbonoxydans TaxID=76726 RepID=A0A4Y3WWT0_9PSEU|nr:hypothetical protein PHY01_44920 [Pseudonocardia hydrocarbonoxydans]
MTGTSTARLTNATEAGGTARPRAPLDQDVHGPPDIEHNRTGNAYELSAAISESARDVGSIPGMA